MREMGSIVIGIGKMCIAEQDEMTSQNNHLIMEGSSFLPWGFFFLAGICNDT
jgi:hypothetical protein